MSSIQLAFQAELSEMFNKTNDYKVYNRYVSNELTGKAIDEILDAITGIPSGGS
jgi:hypothetical protein